MDNYHLKRCLRASVFPACPAAAYSADVHSWLLLKTGDSLAPLLAISTTLTKLSYRDLYSFTLSKQVCSRAHSWPQAELAFLPSGCVPLGPSSWVIYYWREHKIKMVHRVIIFLSSFFWDPGFMII